MVARLTFFERGLMAELRMRPNVKALQPKHLLEWSTDRIEQREDEEVIYLESSKVWVAIPLERVK